MRSCIAPSSLGTCGSKLANDGVDTRGLSHYRDDQSLQSTEVVDRSLLGNKL
jgi:hypothetical protein